MGSFARQTVSCADKENRSDLWRKRRASSEPALMTGAESLLKALRGMGVERIFASPGSDWAPLWEALAKHWAPGEIPQYVSVRHEETAVSMASGYAKATGRLPAVMLHTTVGALHAAMTLRIALHERVPMVVLAGEVDRLRRAAGAEARPPVAAAAHRHRRPGAPGRALREMELRPQHRRAARRRPCSAPASSPGPRRAARSSFPCRASS